MWRTLWCLALAGCAAQPRCQQQLEALAVSVDELVRRADHPCAVDGDCVMRSADLRCLEVAPVAIAKSGEDGLSAGLAELEQRCGTCKGAFDSFRVEEARCRAGRCVAVLRDGG